MSLDLLVSTVVATGQGEIALWGLPGAFDRPRPAVLIVTGAFADPDFMSALPLAIAGQADAVLMHLPGTTGALLRADSIRAVGAVLDEVIGRAFADRPVLLLGVGLGATAAMAARAPQIRRMILAEPLLATAKLWPLRPALRRRFEQAPEHRAFLARMFGVTADGVAERGDPELVAGISVPTDVLLGDEPLTPPRDVSRTPSLVDAPERQTLAAHPQVTLHVAQGAGHNVLQQATPLFEAVLRAACDILVLPAAERALLRRTPLTARRVRYVGGAFEGFAAAYRARNPAAEVVTAGAADAVAVAELRTGDVAGLAAALADPGDLVACLPALPAADLSALQAAFGAAGLAVVAAHDPAQDERLDDVAGDRTGAFARGEARGPLTLVLRRAAPPPRRLIVQTSTYTPFRMDIRTRLPAEGLRTAPELAVVLGGAPPVLPPAPGGQPKLVILQRPSAKGLRLWRAQLASSIRKGWISVIEFDDHPDLIEQMGGGGADWSGFALTHGLQTSTPSLEAAFRPWNPQVKVFANAVFDLPPFQPRRGPHRVFYGALRRGAFAVQVVASLGEVARAFPETEFVVLGEREVFDALPTARKRFYELQTYKTYLDLMSRCSISLSPIAGAALQETKSDAKFLDAASRGVLTLASPTIYRDTIRHGETGLIAERLEDWAPLLRQALGDEAGLNRMTQAAWTYVRDQRMFAHQVADRMGWYQSLWARRHALTAELIARVPGLDAEIRAEVAAGR